MLFPRTTEWLRLKHLSIFIFILTLCSFSCFSEKLSSRSLIVLIYSFLFLHPSRRIFLWLSDTMLISPSIIIIFAVWDVVFFPVVQLFWSNMFPVVSGYRVLEVPLISAAVRMSCCEALMLPVRECLGQNGPESFVPLSTLNSYVIYFLLCVPAAFRVRTIHKADAADRPPQSQNPPEGYEWGGELCCAKALVWRLLIS